MEHGFDIALQVLCWRLLDINCLYSSIGRHKVLLSNARAFAPMEDLVRVEGQRSWPSKSGIIGDRQGFDKRFAHAHSGCFGGV